MIFFAKSATPISFVQKKRDVELGEPPTQRNPVQEFESGTSD